MIKIKKQVVEYVELTNVSLSLPMDVYKQIEQYIVEDKPSAIELPPELQLANNVDAGPGRFAYKRGKITIKRSAKNYPWKSNPEAIKFVYTTVKSVFGTHDKWHQPGKPTKDYKQTNLIYTHIADEINKNFPVDGVTLRKGAVQGVVSRIQFNEKNGTKDYYYEAAKEVGLI